eukprot:TRINITY_DN2788_c0_g3_i1.p1 TRINITY_DN2788_c0_g3~~TRINITY_DN2788_c0_g3_i1.p1  ORF type:complete len:282 (-),score=94.62 TRINITY_DN2788_c0_g3_i1:28-804(-)
MRRGLILIGKVIQTLANGVVFGDKEKYMVPVNGLLMKNWPMMEKIANKILDDIPADEPKSNKNQTPINSDLCSLLHFIISSHIHPLAKYLLHQNQREDLEKILSCLMKLGEPKDHSNLVSKKEVLNPLLAQLQLHYFSLSEEEMKHMPQRKDNIKSHVLNLIRNFDFGCKCNCNCNCNCNCTANNNNNNTTNTNTNTNDDNNNNNTVQTKEELLGSVQVQLNHLEKYLQEMKYVEDNSKRLEHLFVEFKKKNKIIFAK